MPEGIRGYAINWRDKLSRVEPFDDADTYCEAIRGYAIDWRDSRENYIHRRNITSWEKEYTPLAS